MIRADDAFRLDRRGLPERPTPSPALARYIGLDKERLPAAGTDLFGHRLGGCVVVKQLIAKSAPAAANSSESATNCSAGRIGR
jgi:hypothetical protein